MERTDIAGLAGLVCVIVGLVIRANSVAWSETKTRGGYTFDKEQHLFLQDVGMVFLALGVLAFAIVVNSWVAADRPRHSA